jgi:predicted metal-dependent peptidase
MMPITRVDLDTKQGVEWEKTRSTSLWFVPGFTHALYSLLNNSGTSHLALFTHEVPVAATDGHNLILNPVTYFVYNLLNRVFINVHEIMHKLLKHCELNAVWAKQGYVEFADGSRLPYDGKQMNIAEDLYINALLIKAKVGEYHKDWLFDPDLNAETLSSLEIYKMMFKGGYKPPSGQTSFDVLLPPGTTTPDGKPPEFSQAKLDAVIATAAKIAAKQAEGDRSSRGDGALEQKRLFEKFLEPVIDWSDMFQGVFSRSVGNDNYSWTTLDRRFLARGIGFPGRTQFSVGHIIVGGDASGSMSNADITKGYTEVAGMLDEATPEKITVLWFDDHVHRVDELEDVADLRAAQLAHPPYIGGGTNFKPVFRWIEDNCDVPPDALVMFTDGDGYFPKYPPAYPVIWVLTSKPGDHTPPFGEVIHMPKARRDI